MEGYAKLQGLSLSDAIKSNYFENLEDEYDLLGVREYETDKEKGAVKLYSLREAKEMMDIDDEL